MQRLNGADFDSDTILITSENILINAAKKNYDRFKVPTNTIYPVDANYDLTVVPSLVKALSNASNESK